MFTSASRSSSAQPSKSRATMAAMPYGDDNDGNETIMKRSTTGWKAPATESDAECPSASDAPGPPPPSQDENSTSEPTAGSKFQYEYTGLAHSDSIRVLILYPWDPVGDPRGNDALRCDIVHTRLSEPLEGEDGYTALSYVWGDQSCRYLLSVSSARRGLYIGHNLWIALRDLRRRHQPIRLWVDAVCINQLDPMERNHQVRQMQDIFCSARDTIVYLGPNDGGNTGDSAWNYLERHSSWAVDENGDMDFDRPAAMEALIHFRGDLSDVEIDVLGRPWFCRVWVFQEVVVSKTISIQCGRRRVPWDDFCRTLLLSPRYHDRYGASLYRRKMMDPVRHMFQARCAYQENHGLHHIRPPWYSKVDNYAGDGLYILDTLEKARRLEASDPRDKLFALLGISTGFDESRPGTTVDYRKPLRDVYSEFAACMLETTCSYDTFSYLDHGLVSPHLQATELQLPSWVPNWDRSIWRGADVPRSILSTLPPETDAQKAARSLLVKRTLALEDRDRKVVCLGHIIGRVTMLGPIIRLQGKDEMAFENIRHKHGGEPRQMQSELLGHWIGLLGLSCRFYPFRRQNRVLFLPGFATDPGELRAWHDCLSRLVDQTHPPKKHSLESHLLARARKTVSWTDDNSKAATVVTDESSVLDGRAIAVYESPKGEQQLAIVPAAAREHDFIAYFRGARVLFLLRQTDDALDVERPSARRECEIVGECLVNGFDEAEYAEKLVEVTFAIS